MRSYYTIIEQDNVYAGNPTITVLAQEPPQSKFSGLYDADGNKLYTVERCQPIGFIGFGGRSS